MISGFSSGLSRARESSRRNQICHTNFQQYSGVEIRWTSRFCGRNLKLVKLSTKRLLIVTITVVITAIAIWIYSHSLLRSEVSIRASLLKQTPLGTSSAEVRAFVDKQGWLVRNYVGSTGFVKQELGTPNEVIGVTSIEGNLGDFLTMNVTVFWGFDSSNRLVDIWVWRTWDMP
jgi:hypothetical protein